MTHLNVEIKARLLPGEFQGHPSRADFIRLYLHDNGADFKGTDEQTDTYFRVPKGRLKLREGKIENNLIYYERTDQAGPKNSFFKLVRVDDAGGLKEALTQSLGIKVVVRKRREIYFIRNVKFHIDEVPGLGAFVEIEAGNLHQDLPADYLREQCEQYLRDFGIGEDDLVSVSYSDMLLDPVISG